MTFETSIDKINMHIRTVYVSGRSDQGLQISHTECIMSAHSVNTALQNGGNSNQFALFTFKIRTLHLGPNNTNILYIGSKTSPLRKGTFLFL